MSQFIDWAMDWTSEELLLYSWKGQELISSSEHPDELWGPSSLLFSMYQLSNQDMKLTA
jgi:hypothetical protein